MAAARRTLTSTLLRAAAHTSIRASGPCTTALSTATKTPQVWRPVLAAPRATGLRWYSAKDSLQPSESRTYSFGDVQEQLHINEQLEKSGAEETATGQKKVVFVDVREPEELLETGRIPGAINVPITSAIQSFHIADEDFTDMYGFERPSKDTHLMFYCKAGVRAKSAAGLAAHAGWQHVGDYPGSWLDWDAQKGPKEQRQKDGPGWERV